LAADAVPLAQVVDQSVRASTALMSLEDLTACRQRYEKAAGCPPPDEHLPSIEQLSGLRALILARRAPYVDFSIWSHHGARIAKFRRAEATIFIGGEFVTKAIEGPSTPESWEDSWALFAVAMTSLGAASPGSLNRYANGIRMLRQYHKWSMLLTTDLVVRSERWGRLREEFARNPPPGYDAARPWDHIISASSFGQEGPCSMWWTTQFLLPANAGISSPALAGMPKASGTPPPNKPRKEPSQPASSGEVCTNFNARSGKCKGGGACPHGRRHVCSVCGGQHRACDRHGANADKKGDKGKGKGDKGRKGAKVGRKGDFQTEVIS